MSGLRSERERLLAEALRQRAIGIVRTSDPAAAVEAAEAMSRAGLRAVEITLTVPGALEVLVQMHRGAGGFVLGAGTVLSGEAAEAAIEAGAAFIVSPIATAEVISAGHRLGRPVIAGALTPQEVHSALALGADAVKIFPAGPLGTGYLRSMAAVFPDVTFVPTGGITVESAPEWLASGAAAVGLGSELVKGSSEAIRARVEDLLRRCEGQGRTG